MIAPADLEKLLREKIPGSEHVEVKDLTGTQDHYEALIVASAFAGKSLIERHRLVYAALGDRMKADIHALTLKTKTPEEHRVAKCRRWKE
jgi:stress-induced morphogen